MKTIITIEDGKVTVETDDGQVSIAQSAVNSPARFISGEGGVADTSVGERVKAAERRIDEATAGMSEAALKGMEIAKHVVTNGGVPIDDTQRPRKPAGWVACGFCRRRKDGQPCKRHGGSDTTKYIPKGQRDEKVDWCKHCGAYTTHPTAEHPKPVPGRRSACHDAKVEEAFSLGGESTGYRCNVCGNPCETTGSAATDKARRWNTSQIKQAQAAPEFLPGHEKTEEEIASWNPKPILPGAEEYARASRDDTEAGRLPKRGGYQRYDECKSRRNT